MIDKVTQIPKTWEAVSLGDIVELKYGKSLTKSNRDSGDYPVYGSNGIIGFHSNFIVENPCLIVGRKGSIGEVHICKNPCYPIDTTYYINEFYEQPVNYWLYLLKALPLGQLNRASAVPGLNREDAYKIRIPLPPLNEQRRIVAKIEALKARSQRVKEALEAIPPLLDQFRQSVLAAAFRGDLTADWREKNPDVEPASVLLERIRAERRRRWEEAELERMKASGKTPTDDKWKSKYDEPEPIDTVNLSELPIGWCWAKFETVATIASNLVQPSNYPNYPHIAPDNVEKGSGKLLEYRTVEEDGVTSPKHLFFPGQIIYSKIRPYLSKCVLIDFEGLCSADMYPVDSHICSEYLFYYILSDTFLDLIQKESGSRVVLPKANQKQVYAISVPVPPLEEQIAIVEKVKRLLIHKDCVIAIIKNQLEKFEELQQSILAKAFRGELVPQDPNDEPASVLLERIRAERAKQDAAKTAKKSTAKTTGQRRRRSQQQDSESVQLGLPGLE
ncbi:restriction endonuclease subunit S [Gloeocapsa sp. BRSZ]